MRLDFEDVLSGVFGRTVLISLYFLSAIWAGSLIGSLGAMAGNRSCWGVVPPGGLFDILWSPGLLINLWIVPNVGLLAIAAVYLMVSENTGFAAWGAIFGMESIFVMLGWDTEDMSMMDQLIGWGSCLLLVSMACTGLWLIRHMRMNRWAHEMAALSAENAMRRAEREAMAEGRNGPSEPPGDLSA
jgi:hypothetical protein